MSYCRWSDGDVYLYPTEFATAEAPSKIECCGCWLEDIGCVTLTGHAAAIAHLEQHRAAGHEVPEYAFERLRFEHANGDRPVWQAPTAAAGEP